MSKAHPSVALVSSGHGLLEAPAWHDELELLVADAKVGGVWSFDRKREPRQVVPHRRGIGGMALHENGGVVVGGRNIAYKRLLADDLGPTVVLLERDPEHGVVGFNDLTTDWAGRIYVGSLGFVPMHGETGEGRPGALHRIDLDGSAQVVATDVALTNGLCFSPDGRLLYHADSLRRHVRVYDVASDGSLGPHREFARFDAGQPDGMAIDAEGNVWIALAFANAVVALTPDGQEAARLEIPVPMVTSLCFGGADLRDLYILTGSEGSPAHLQACIFHSRVDVPGLRPSPARVPVAER